MDEVQMYTPLLCRRLWCMGAFGALPDCLLGGGMEYGLGVREAFVSCCIHLGWSSWSIANRNGEGDPKKGTSVRPYVNPPKGPQ